MMAKNLTKYFKAKSKFFAAMSFFSLVVGLVPTAYGDVQINPEYMREEGDKSEFEKPVCDKKYGDNDFWKKKNLNFFTCAGREYMGGDVYCKEKGAAGELPVISTPVCLRTEKNMKSPTSCARAEIPLRCREKYDEKFGDLSLDGHSKKKGRGDLLDDDEESELDDESIDDSEEKACTTCAKKMAEIFKTEVMERSHILCNDTGDSSEKSERAFKKTQSKLHDKLTKAQCSAVEKTFVKGLLNVALKEQKDGDSDRCKKALKHGIEILKSHRDENDRAESEDSENDDLDSSGLDAVQ